MLSPIAWQETSMKNLDWVQCDSAEVFIAGTQPLKSNVQFLNKLDTSF